MSEYYSRHEGIEIDDGIDLINQHVADTNNPHGVTKTQVGLSNVDNTSDANKPVSTAQALAIQVAMEQASKGWKQPALDDLGDLTVAGLPATLSPGLYIFFNLDTSFCSYVEYPAKTIGLFEEADTFRLLSDDYNIYYVKNNEFVKQSGGGGSGSVDSVNSIGPDGGGNVLLAAGNIKMVNASSSTILGMVGDDDNYAVLKQKLTDEGYLI